MVIKNNIIRNLPTTIPMPSQHKKYTKKKFEKGHGLALLRWVRVYLLAKKRRGGRDGHRIIQQHSGVVEHHLGQGLVLIIPHLEAQRSSATAHNESRNHNYRQHW
jgi:hypothetical protein